MSAVGVRHPGSRILHDTVPDTVTRRPVTRCSERPVAIVWLSAVAASATGPRPHCVNCAQVNEVGPLQRRSWWMPTDPKPAAVAS